MATIFDVAKEAGVSIATVSRVLNGSSNVSHKSEEAVREAVKKLRYASNNSARNLRTQKSKVIIALVRNLTNPFYSRVLSGICSVLNPLGYTIFIGNNNGEISQTLQSIRMLDYHQADGLIMMNCTDEDVWLNDYVGKYPIVQTCEYSLLYNLPRVRLDHELDGYKATSHLISLGHKRIAILGATNRHSSTLGRFAGFYRAMSEHGLHTMWKTESDGDYNFEIGKERVTALLKEKPEERPTAIFCISDQLALSAILAANEMGLSVPEDLSVIGCDDIDYATMAHPFLSTIHIPCFDLGKRSAELLLKQMEEGYSQEPEDIVVDTQLILRESCAAPS